MRPSRALLLLPLLLLLATVPVAAEERILGYDADVAVLRDGSMSVTETIRVRAEGERIRRGIYREFPTTYRDPQGHRYRVGFEFLGARRDGEPEAWHAEDKINGVRIYLGREDLRLKPGTYTYQLRYRTTRQLGFFDEHDELYWNVTGQDWAFPIERATATLRLPEAVPARLLQAYGYTGAQGSREAALDAETFDGGARYATTRTLAPQEGLSVVLEFPKGIVAEPDAGQKLRWLLADNSQLLIGLGGLLLLWLYYGWAWNRWGRDPETGVRIPIYEPPHGYSPASLRFIREMGYDKTCFAAALLGLAAKGALRIEEDDDGDITLVPTGADVRFAPGEAAIRSELFPAGRPLKLEQKIHATMRTALSRHKAALARDYEKKYFFTHTGKLVPGLLVSLATLVAAVLSLEGETRFVALFLCVWLSFWSIAVAALVGAAVAATRSVRGIGSGIGAVFTWVFAVPFLIGELAGLVFLAATAGIGFVLIFAALIGTNIAFYEWMKAPTQDGARLLDRIEGFRWYLGVAEKDELASAYRPEVRPERFSEYLPYAYALDVEGAWAKRFADALPKEQSAALQPSWYHGSRGFGTGTLTGFTSGLTSSLSSAVSSSSRAPGSSSGGGGGGGAGGGGGGGGGGGW